MKRWLLIAMLALLSTGLQAQKSHAGYQLKDHDQQLQKFPQSLMMKMDIRQPGLHNRIHKDIKYATPSNSAALIVNDSLYEYDWDAGANAWKAIASYRELYTYDKQGRPIGELYSKRNSSGKWRNIARTSSFYNTNDDIIIWLMEEWDTIQNVWIPYERDTMTFNSKHVELTAKWYFYNTISQKWFLGEYHLNNDAGFELDFYSMDWDPLTFAFSGGSRVTSTPNASDRPLEEIYKDYDPATGNWENSSKNVYVYIHDTLISTHTESAWDKTGAAWQESLRQTYTYSGTGSLLEQELNEYWDQATLKWISDDKTTYTYLNDLLSVELHEMWDNTMQKWIGDHRTTYTYQNNLIAVELQELWDNDLQLWINNIRTTNTYENNLVSVELRENWDSDLQTWVNISRNNYYYFTDKKMKEVLMQYWTTEWVDFARMINNSHGLLVEYWYKYFDDSGRILLEYDQNDNPTVVTRQEWNALTLAWQNKWKDVYYYSILTGINTHRPDAPGCEFRNPYLPGTKIQCSLLRSGEIYELSLYSLTGSCVHRQPISGSAPFSIDKTLPEGLYLLTINSKSERIYAKKIILQRP